MYCEPQLREIIARVRPDVIVEDNVVAFPALLTAGAPFVRIVSLQPARGEGRRHRAGLLRAARPTTAASGRRFRAEYDRTHRAMWAGVQRVGRRAGRAAAAGPRVHPRVGARRTSTCSPRRPTTPTRRRSTRPGTGWTRACARPTSTTSLPAAVADRPSGSALVYLSLGSLGSADVDLMRAPGRRARPHAAPLHREQGPAGTTEYELADNMVGAGVPAADDADPAGRPGHHARRQQHDDRGAALRQADDPAAAVLGPVRQRAAHATSSASACASRRTPSPTTTCCAALDRRAGRRRPAGRLAAHRRARSAHATGCAVAPTSSSRSPRVRRRAARPRDAREELARLRRVEPARTRCCRPATAARRSTSRARSGSLGAASTSARVAGYGVVEDARGDRYGPSRCVVADGRRTPGRSRATAPRRRCSP